MSLSDYKDIDDYPFEALDKSNAPIILDTETVGKTYESNIPIYFSWKSDFGSGAGPAVTERGLQFLRALCEVNRPKVFHNAKFDIGVLDRFGMPMRGEIHDTCLMHSLLYEHGQEQGQNLHALDDVVYQLCGKRRPDIRLLVQEQRGRPPETMNLNVPQPIMHVYSHEDAIDCGLVFDKMLPRLQSEGLYDYYRTEVETELCYIEIEERGVLANRNAIDEALVGLESTLATISTRIYEGLGESFNIASYQQLGKALAKHVKLHKRTKTGWATDKETLQEFIEDPKVQTIFAWRFLEDARKKLANYHGHIRKGDGRLHSSYRQTTSTGRTASSGPNLQNIPKQRGRLTALEVGDDELADLCANAFRTVRKVFIASPGSLLVSRDYAQVEYRAAVHYSGAKRLIDRICAGENLHKIVCMDLFGEIDEHKYHIAKTLNFGLLYGLGARSLRVRLGRLGNIANAQVLIRDYNQKLWELQILKKQIEGKALRTGHVRDMFGRIYRVIPGRTYAIVNAICQGTGANIKKAAVRRVVPLFRGRRSGVQMDIHDDLVVELYPEDADLLQPMQEAMEDFPQFDVPIVTELSVGPNLLDMEKSDNAGVIARLEAL